MANEKIKVWLSSVDHMNEFTAISKKYYGWKSTFRAKKIPPQFPYIQMFLTRYPIIFFSIGEMNLADAAIVFNSQQYNTVKKPKNLISRSFSIPYNELKVEKYTQPDPFMKSFNITWVKIDFFENHQPNHYLISVDIPLGVRMANKSNNEIFEKIKNRTEGNLL